MPRSFADRTFKQKRDQVFALMTMGYSLGRSISPSTGSCIRSVGVSEKDESFTKVIEVEAENV